MTWVMLIETSIYDDQNNNNNNYLPSNFNVYTIQWKQHEY